MLKTRTRTELCDRTEDKVEVLFPVNLNHNISRDYRESSPNAIINFQVWHPVRDILRGKYFPHQVQSIIS